MIDEVTLAPRVLAAARTIESMVSFNSGRLK
jgi:hypothetical protein